MEQPVVHFELIGRDGASLEGFVSYSEVFGCEADAGNTPIGAVVQLTDELPEDVTFYVSVGAGSRRPRVIERPAAPRRTSAALAAPSR